MTAPSPILRVGWLVLVLAVTGSSQVSVDEAMRRVTALMKQGQFAAAEPVLRSIVKQAPNPRRRYMLGFCLMNRYDFAEAEPLLREAATVRPPVSAYLAAHAKCLLEMGRNREAITVLDRCVRLDNDAASHFRLAMCHLNIGESAAAESSLRTSLKLDPAQPEALYKLGKLLCDGARFEESVEHLRRCLVQDPRHVEARFCLGLALRKTGDDKGARTAFEAVVKRIPGHAGALWGLSRVLLRLGEKKEARKVLAEFRKKSVLEDEIHLLRLKLKTTPAHLGNRKTITRKLLTAGRLDEALTNANAARALAPRDPSVYYLLDEVHTARGRVAEAARARKHAEELIRNGGR